MITHWRLTLRGRSRNMSLPSREEVSSMCYERYRRRRREDEESREIWLDFERTTPISEPEAPEVAEPERSEPERAEELTASEQ
jgi:hypothetical protein